MAKSTRKPPSRKAARRKHFVPPKPYPEFTLTPHAGGKWMKELRGKLHYFGNWGRRVNGKMERLPDDGWQNALKEFKAQAEDLYAGRTPRVKDNSDGLTVRELCNRFLTAKHRKVESGELFRRTFDKYRQTTDRLQSSRTVSMSSTGTETKSGEGGIRTLGTREGYTGFRDRPVRPLRHLSEYYFQRFADCWE